MAVFWASPAGIERRAALSLRGETYWTEERREETSRRMKALSETPAGQRRSAAVSALLKARWAALSDEERAHRYRQMAANYMLTHPEIAIYPDRWLADLFRGNG
jgi:CHASE1-domain containing sensor protein